MKMMMVLLKSIMMKITSAADFGLTLIGLITEYDGAAFFNKLMKY